MIKELDLVIAITDINEEILSGTIGVVLSISNDNLSYLVEFVDENNITIGDEVIMVNEHQVRLFKVV